MSRRHGRRGPGVQDAQGRRHARASPGSTGTAGSTGMQPPTGDGPVAAEGSAPLLVVAVCAGYRCAGLRRSSTGGPAGEGGADVLPAAVRERPLAVLVSTGCQGRCHLAPVAAVGNAVPARTTGNSASALSWTAAPVLLGLLDRERDRALADWVRAAAPATADLPPLLRGALPAGRAGVGVVPPADGPHV